MHGTSRSSLQSRCGATCPHNNRRHNNSGSLAPSLGTGERQQRLSAAADRMAAADVDMRPAPPLKADVEMADSSVAGAAPAPKAGSDMYAKMKALQRCPAPGGPPLPPLAAACPEAFGVRAAAARLNRARLARARAPRLAARARARGVPTRGRPFVALQAARVP